MIPGHIFNNALNAGRIQSFGDRFDCAAQGMKHALDTFLQQNNRYVSRFPSRHPNGFNNIYYAARDLNRSWQNMAVLSPALEERIILLIQRIETWLKRCKESRFNQAPVSDTQKLYWQVAWCVSASHYKYQALNRVRARNQMVSMKDPVENNFVYGNLYHFCNSGYAYSIHNILYRGDNRSPLEIFESGGLFGRDFMNDNAYKPWFQGQAMGGTISTTNSIPLALNAGGKAAKQFGPSNDAALLPWMNAALKREQESYALGHGRIVPRAYIYEILPNGKESMRVTNSPQAPGTEEVFLAIPNANISRWWLRLSQPEDVILGPFPFTAAKINGLDDTITQADPVTLNVIP